jgi:3-hydroxy acid dehydrogenase/malonic semialdehyde reductase
MTEKSVLTPGAIALVTGATSGIGAALTEALLAKGCKVIGAARNVDTLQAMAARLGAPFHPLVLDITDAGATAALPDRLPPPWHDISILVNNAGHDGGGRERFDACETDALASIIETNVTGMIRVAKAIIPGMLARGGGDIVNVGSTSGHFALAHDAAYVASKFAISGLTRALRADYDGMGLRVIEVAPGIARTGFAEARYQGDSDRAEAFYESFPAVLEADDVARTIIFALEQPPHVTLGEILMFPSHGRQ